MTVTPDRDSLCHHILGLYERLRAQVDLAPSPVVDALFGDLVSACAHAESMEAAAVLADPRIHRVRAELVRLCAEGESLLENVWARKALAAADPGAETAAFPYFGNYEQLARLELHALAAAGHRPETTRRVCFIGGGPLPLTALLLSRILAAEVTVVDRDADAVDLSRRLLDRLAPARRISVITADAESAADMARAVAGHDVVVVAALVGSTRMQKRAVLRAVGAAVEPGAYVVIRTADGLRSLLYPVVDVRDVYDAGLAPEVVVHPFGEVINSVLVARRRCRRPTVRAGRRRGPG
ncbi:nicotianamine synthase family protein [Actinoplanes sp. NPDC049668]|uniref:nicotianamine synthase family protein n=1 Tax=Actinoplanes sp. NPDC049668 TaxID=3363904 RepID=UPI00379E3DDA